MTNICIISGGMLGVSLIIYLSDHIVPVYRKIKRYLKKYVFGKRPIFSNPTVDIDQPIEIHYDYVVKTQAKRKVFTARNRRIIRLWRKFGLIGITALTP